MMGDKWRRAAMYPPTKANDRPMAISSMSDCSLCICATVAFGSRRYKAGGSKIHRRGGEAMVLSGLLAIGFQVRAVPGSYLS